ncbi:hypothetical protein CDCA_CDCA13G3662 [Cyanidium caldarium]|uniref:Elongator complex protein 2 n=1 Tax=Cyanidium caldarium TaxID=2771 RepID=A0AAV9IZA2_CYACA|nr:hypothetical protein CDCA_CDCA13G3662 [Cyanidium caldarium]
MSSSAPSCRAQVTSTCVSGTPGLMSGALDAAECPSGSSGGDSWHSWLAFASGAVVYLADRAGVQHALIGHRARVNSLRWQRVLSGSPLRSSGLLASVDAAGELILWQRTRLTARISLRPPEAAAVAAAASAICVATAPASPAPCGVEGAPETCCFAGTSDGVLYATRGDRCVSCASLDGLPEALAAASWPQRSSDLLVAVGGTDTRIHLYRFDTATLTFQPLQQLSGHSDWVRDLACVPVDDALLLLASAGQDGTARLWQVTAAATTASSQLTVQCIAVLAEHRAGLTRVQWVPMPPSEPSSSTARLLTSAMDRTWILWQLRALPADDRQRWTPAVRGGERGEEGLEHGFFSATYFRDGTGSEYIVASARNGALHTWRCVNGHLDWRAVASFAGGHAAAITDIDWQPRHGRWLLSVSCDMTARIFAQRSEAGEGVPGRWREVARPQTHGHALFCGAFVSTDGLVFASGAEEKAVRLFEAPGQFVQRMSERASTANGSTRTSVDAADERAWTATRPPLSLTNQPAFGEEQRRDAADRHGYDIAESPPEHDTEACLAQDTLWPERDKLFAHANAIRCLACRRVVGRGEVLASACNAQRASDAGIALWNGTPELQPLAVLSAHQLTVHALRFGRLAETACVDGDDPIASDVLLSVSRDRSWTLWDMRTLQPLHRQPEAHSRMILCCAWTRCDRGEFVTGGRDKRLQWWRVRRGPPTEMAASVTSLHAHRFAHAVTAVDALPFDAERVTVLVGLESGQLQALLWDGHVSTVQALPPVTAHAGAVNCVRFRPTVGAPDRPFEYASGGEDGALHFGRIQWGCSSDGVA